MSSLERLDALRRQNKELLQRLRHKTQHLQRLDVDCSRKRLENDIPEPVSGVWKLVTSSARDRTPLRGREESLLNVSDAFRNLTVGKKSPDEAGSALCQPINVTKTPSSAGEKET